MTQHIKPIVLFTECLRVKLVKHDGCVACSDFVETLKK